MVKWSASRRPILDRHLFAVYLECSMLDLRYARIRCMMACSKHPLTTWVMRNP